jgi:WD40 repeat protein
MVWYLVAGVCIRGRVGPLHWYRRESIWLVILASSQTEVDCWCAPLTTGVTCLDIDHTGSRLVTGSMDYTVRLYDFNGMKRDLKAFRYSWRQFNC